MQQRMCKTCGQTKYIHDFRRQGHLYRHQCKECYARKCRTGRPNTGQFKKGDAPKRPFTKGHTPWNKGLKGKHKKCKSRYREIAYAVYEKRCAVCFTETKLHVHHIDGDVKNFDEENLMVACDSCHRRLHGLYSLGFNHNESFIIVKKYYEWIRWDTFKSNHNGSE